MTDDLKRRASDDEAFKYSIVASQAEIKTKVELLHDMVTLQLGDHKTRLEKLEEAVIGTARHPGLAEQNRNVVKDIAKLGGIITLVGFVLFKIISPLYDAWVSRWAQQKIAATVAEEPQTKAKIVRKPVAPIDSQIKKQ